MKLKDFLTESNRSTADFAHEVEVDRNTLYNIMQGRFEPRLGTAMRIVEKTEGKVTFKDLMITEKKEDKKTLGITKKSYRTIKKTKVLENSSH